MRRREKDEGRLKMTREVSGEVGDRCRLEDDTPSVKGAVPLERVLGSFDWRLAQDWKSHGVLPTRLSTAETHQHRESRLFVTFDGGCYCYIRLFVIPLSLSKVIVNVVVGAEYLMRII